MPPDSSNSTPCPPDLEFVALVEGRLDGEKAARLRQHLETCPSCAAACRELEESLEMTSGNSPATDDMLAKELMRQGGLDLPLPAGPKAQQPQLTRGGTVGRYLVLSLLGRGGMGQVYAAYDPELNRKVALKVLSVSTAASDSRERLILEARALGKLSHPNVVQIYDVGEHQGDVFLAMELVEGETLGEYCRSMPPPTWREVLDAYLDAAEGLAAAHAQGLIHRDIKPSNILRGKDGRVRVVDFGLAKGKAQSPGAPAPMDGPTMAPGATPEASAALTAVGAVVGTPLYMAPEQHRSANVSPASDQYGLCAALYEGLYGVPPFAASSLEHPADLLASKLAGPRPPPASSPVPRWVNQVLLRGLAPQPEDRYPSIAALIQALRDDPVARRRARWVRAGAIAGGAMLVALAVAGWFKSGVFTNPCAHAAEELAGTWDGPMKDKLWRAVREVHRPSAEDTAGLVSTLLDTYAAKWVVQRGQVCNDDRAHRQRRDLLELRSTCLDRRLEQLHALTSLLVEKPDPRVLDNAVQAATSLLPLDACANVETLKSELQLPEDPALRARVLALRPRVDRLKVLGVVKPKAAVAEAEPLLAELKQIPVPDLFASAAFEVGKFRLQVGDDKGGMALLQEAAEKAAEARDLVLVVKTWAMILNADTKQGHLDESAAVLRMGPTIIAEAKDEGAEASWLHSQGLVLMAQNRFGEAKSVIERAVALAERASGAQSLAVASYLNTEGEVFRSTGAYPEAIAAAQRVLDIRKKELGPHHYLVGQTLNNLALLKEAAGDYPGALDLGRQGLKISEETFGPDSINQAPILMNMGEVLVRLGRFPEARAEILHARTIAEKALGPDHPMLRAILAIQGIVQLEEGNVSLALASFRQELALDEKTLEPTNPRLGTALALLGLAEVRAGHLDDAAPLLERAKALREKLGNPQDEELNIAILGLGELAVARKKPAEAVRLLEPVSGPTNIYLVYKAHLVLAEALWANPDTRARARELMEATRTYYASIGHAPGKEVAEHWLAQHPLGR